MKVAALDLGTNTFLVLIAESDGRRILRVLHDEVRVVRLGQGVNQSRSFHPDALARADVCLKDYAAKIRSTGAEKILACATSAARDVKNGDELRNIARTHGIPLEIISGEREAELTFKGTLDRDSADGPVLIIDVGGGSTELIFGDGSGIASRVSLDIGSVRLTEMFITGHPIAKSELEKIKNHIGNELKKTAGSRPAEKKWNNLKAIAVAGTPTTLATLDQGLPFESERVHGYRLPTQTISRWIERLAVLSVEERQRLAGMEPKRADVIVAGALILQLAAESMGASELEVSIRGLRYGIAKEIAGA